MRLLSRGRWARNGLLRAVGMAPVPSSWGAGTPLCDAGLGLGAAVCSWRLDSVILMVPSSSDSVQLRMLCGSGTGYAR